MPHVADVAAVSCCRYTTTLLSDTTRLTCGPDIDDAGQNDLRPLDAGADVHQQGATPAHNDGHDSFSPFEMVLLLIVHVV
jgi:hypothetical protein